MISIISPVYNGETYVERYLESLLNLSYSDIQLIIVNDGSTDRTKDIILSYEKKLKDKFNEFQFINKENGGAASCLNYAIKYAKGEYLFWPDMDDELMPNSMELYLEKFQSDSNIDAVIGKAKILDFETREPKGYLQIKNKQINKRNYFRDLVVEKDVIFAPLTMIKLSSFRKANKGNEIFVSHGGQNWQMLLPMAYYCNVVYMDKVTYVYNFRENSHSHSVTLQKMNKRIDLHKEILENCIDKIDMSQKEKKKYHNIIRKKYNEKKLKIYFLLQKKNEFKEEYKKSDFILKLKYLPILILFRFGYKIYLLKKGKKKNG